MTELSLDVSSAGESRYEQERALAPIGKDEHYGNLKGSNDFEGERVGIVAGSRHTAAFPEWVPVEAEGEIQPLE